MSEQNAKHFDFAYSKIILVILQFMLQIIAVIVYVFNSLSEQNVKHLHFFVFFFENRTCCTSTITGAKIDLLSEYCNVTNYCCN